MLGHQHIFFDANIAIAGHSQTGLNSKNLAGF